MALFVCVCAFYFCCGSNKDNGNRLCFWIEKQILRESRKWEQIPKILSSVNGGELSVFYLQIKRKSYMQIWERCESAKFGTVQIGEKSSENKLCETMPFK